MCQEIQARNKCHYRRVNVCSADIATVILVILPKVTVMFPLLHNMKCLATGDCVSLFSYFASILKEEQTRRLHYTDISFEGSVFLGYDAV